MKDNDKRCNVKRRAGNKQFCSVLKKDSRVCEVKWEDWKRICLWKKFKFVYMGTEEDKKKTVLIQYIKQKLMLKAGKVVNICTHVKLYTQEIEEIYIYLSSHLHKHTLFTYVYWE